MHLYDHIPSYTANIVTGLSELLSQTITNTLMESFPFRICFPGYGEITIEMFSTIGCESLHHWLPKLSLQNSLHATKTIHRFCYKEFVSKGTLY